MTTLINPRVLKVAEIFILQKCHDDFFFYNIPVINLYFLELQTNEMLVNDRWLLQQKNTTPPPTPQKKIGTSEMSLVTNSPPTLYPFPFLHEVNIGITSPTTIYGNSSVFLPSFLFL